MHIKQRERARLQDLAKYHVLAVEVRRGHGGDEESACSVCMRQHLQLGWLSARHMQRSHGGCMSFGGVCAQPTL